MGLTSTDVPIGAGARGLRVIRSRSPISAAG
jgi:hypothetical protein